MEMPKSLVDAAVIGELKALKKRIEWVEGRFAEMRTVLMKEFPKYFAGDTALGIATNGETLGSEKLPDIHPIDLRSPAQIAAGESVNLSDLVRMDA